MFKILLPNYNDFIKIIQKKCIKEDTLKHL
jgi:hypothetical protein